MSERKYLVLIQQGISELACKLDRDFSQDEITMAVKAVNAFKFLLSSEIANAVTDYDTGALYLVDIVIDSVRQHGKDLGLQYVKEFLQGCDDKQVSFLDMNSLCHSVAGELIYQMIVMGNDALNKIDEHIENLPLWQVLEEYRNAEPIAYGFFMKHFYDLGYESNDLGNFGFWFLQVFNLHPNYR